MNLRSNPPVLAVVSDPKQSKVGRKCPPTVGRKSPRSLIHKVSEFVRASGGMRKFVRTPLYWAYGWACFLSFLLLEGLLLFALCKWAGAI